MGLAAFAFVYLGGLPPGIVPQKIAQSANSFPLLAAPLFILMGNILNSAGITERIFTFATACVGWLRGGFACQYSGQCDFRWHVRFGCGGCRRRRHVGNQGDAREGYDPETAAAITAASATIGTIIPPSLPMVIYGVSADVSIGGLFLAGVIPGLLMAGALMLMVAEVARRRNLPRSPFPGLRDVWVATNARTGR